MIRRTFLALVLMCGSVAADNPPHYVIDITATWYPLIYQGPEGPVTLSNEVVGILTWVTQGQNTWLIGTLVCESDDGISPVRPTNTADMENFDTSAGYTVTYHWSFVTHEGSDGEEYLSWGYRQATNPAGETNAAHNVPVWMRPKW